MLITNYCYFCLDSFSLNYIGFKLRLMCLIWLVQAAEKSYVLSCHLPLQYFCCWWLLYLEDSLPTTPTEIQPPTQTWETVTQTSSIVKWYPLSLVIWNIHHMQEQLPSWILCYWRTVKLFPCGGLVLFMHVVCSQSILLLPLPPFSRMLFPRCSSHGCIH